MLLPLYVSSVQDPLFVLWAKKNNGKTFLFVLQNISEAIRLISIKSGVMGYLTLFFFCYCEMDKIKRQLKIL
jgi:hypothetical protein